MKMTISSYDSSSISTLFASLNSSRSTSFNSNINSMTGLLSEYNSIKTGSYYKLLKNYYSGERSNDTSVSDDKTQNNAEAYKKQLSELKTDATNLYDAANALLDKSSMHCSARWSKRMPREIHPMGMIRIRFIRLSRLLSMVTIR